MTGVVEGGSWTSWWNRAKSHPQVLPAKAPRNSFVWSESAESAERMLVDEFVSASFQQQMDLARKHAKRGGAVKEAIMEGLLTTLRDIDDPGGSHGMELMCLVRSRAESCRIRAQWM